MSLKKIRKVLSKGFLESLKGFLESLKGFLERL
jgi:hypothetical protein